MFSVAIGVAVILIILYCIGASQEQTANLKKSVPKKVLKTSPIEEDDDSKWEVVNRKTTRWAELGFGDGGLFPGYGRLYDREFKVWYCNIGSKKIKGEQIIYDRFPLHYDPKNSERITGDDVYLNRLDNTKGYESLYTGLDNKNRKRWYFALITYTPTWIETARALEEENKEDIIINEVEVPVGWQLVRNHSTKWIELGYDNGFPGYGEIYEVSFEVWCSTINSKEEKKQPDISIHLALYGIDFNIYYFERVCKKIEGLNNKELSFNRLLKTKGYIQLYSGLDHSTKTRWHIGMREKKPTYFYATSAE